MVFPILTTTVDACGRATTYITLYRRRQHDPEIAALRLLHGRHSGDLIMAGVGIRHESALKIRRSVWRF